MKHIQSSQLSDYVRNLLDPRRAAAVSTHLETGCRRCVSVEAGLRRVLGLAAADARSEPPAGALRSVKAHFALQAPKAASTLGELAMRLVGDSFLEPAPAGVRSGAGGVRCLRYEGGELELGLQVMPGADPNELTLSGELLSGNSGPVADAPTFLLCGGRIVSQSCTDEIGAFALSASGAPADRLCLVLDDGATLSVGLPSRGERASA